MRTIAVRAAKLVCAAVAPVFSCATVRAEEVTIAADVLGPEGPLYVDGNLYYVGWVSNTPSKWDGKSTTVLNNLAGCSHNGLALTRQRTLLLACTDNHGAILELDLNGKPLRRWDADNKGNKFVGGINDVMVTGNGGAYATVFGPPEDVPTAVAGKILTSHPAVRNGSRWRGISTTPTASASPRTRRRSTSAKRSEIAY